MVITYRGLELEIPYEAEQIEDIKIVVPLNDHGSLYAKLLIPEGKISEYINKSIKDEKIIASRVNENGKKSKLFVGKINNVHMSFKGGLHMMEIKCLSYTKDFDIKKNSRTFADLDMTYEQVIDKVLSSYGKKDFTDNLSHGTAIEKFVLQYEETDWQFIKRIATHFNGILLPEATEECGRFHFGIPDINNSREIVLNDYEIIKNIDEYNKNEALGFEDNFLHEYTKWDIVSRETLVLGEQVLFRDIPCVAYKIKTEVYKEEIRTIYTLAPSRGIRTPFKTNPKIFGMSIPATVKDVQGNTMSVHFEIDKSYETYSNQKYFTYAIESSAWYCMPEKESKVHIYFPTNDESEAIAVHAVRSTSAGAAYASKTQNPDNKSFSHTSGSEMSFTPSDMNFTSDAGGASTVNLSQGGDVSISGTNINLTASEDVQLGMRQGDGDGPTLKPQMIQISAGEKIDFSKGGTLGIEVVDQTFLQGPMIKYEGSIKDSVPLPDEIAHRNDSDAEEINKINEQAKQYEEQKIQEAKSKVGFGLVALAVGAVAIVAAVATCGAGVALAVGAIGAIAAVSGASKIAEGASDYKKAVESGDFSKSYNFMRDSLMGGNDTLYNLVTYGAVLISGVAIAIMTGGVATEVLAKTGIDMGGDVAFNMIADYADDGHVNNGVMSYMESACMSGSLSGVNVGVMNKFKKLEKAKKLSCKTIGRIRMASDIGLDLMGQLATSGDMNITSTILKKYVGNKLCFSDPVDGATGSLYIPATDIVLPDIHEEFKIERKYESVNPRIGTLGKNWTTNFETFLDISENKVNVLCTDGHVEIFNLIDDEWINDKGAAKIYVLKKNDDEWSLKCYKEKKTYYYDSEGKLKKICDRFNNEVTLTYVNNNIETLTTFSNYKLFFTYKDNKVIQIKDEIGRTVQYKYDGDYLTEVVHVDQGITRYTYDSEGFIDSITDQNGQTYTKNFFDKKGRVIRQDFPDDDNCTITYDDNSKEVTFYYKKSKRTEKTRFNNEGLITHLFYEDGTTEEFKYDDYQNKTYEKDRNGYETFKVYNEYGSLIKETKADGFTTEYVYDEEQNLIKETDNLGKEVLYTYDSTGNLKEQKTKININEYKVESYTYDSFGRIITKTDSLNNTSRYEYDIRSLVDGKNGKDPVKVTTSSGYEYEYEYDEVGRNTSITTDYGTIEFGYNNLDFVSKIKDANGNVTLKYYDNMGNLTSVYTPNANIGDFANGQPYKYSYDHMDRLISVKNPLGAVQQSIRDSEGNIIKEVNPNFYNSDLKDGGTGIEYVYDKDNRKIKSIYPDGGIERFVYDSNGNVIKHISPQYYDEASDDGLGYSYTYDNMNHLKSIINEEGITEKTFEYDLHGNIVKEIDNEGNASLFKYDLVNNLLEKRIPVEKDENGKLLYNVTSYEYDKNGNKIIEKHGTSKVYEDELCSSFNEIYFKYDAENRLVEVSDKYGAKTKYKYDCLNHKTYESFKINDTTDKVIHYIYDKVGNLVQKKEEIDGGFIWPQNKGKNIWAVTNYEYDRNGNVTKIKTPNGYEIFRVYDEIDRVIEEFQKDVRSGIYRSKVYEYDKADNIISLSEYSGKDAQLINDKYSSENDYDLKVIDRHYKKKENDKRFAEINFEFDSKKKAYVYDNQDRLTHFINVSGNITRLFYDKNDRIIKQVLPEQYDESKDDGAGTVYSYNVQGKVIEVKNALGQTITKNTYDPKGNLKTSIDGENNKVEYTYTLLGQIKNIITPNSRNENKPAQSYSYDARGNITGIVDGNGNETKYLLDDWGRIVQITTPEGGIEKYTYDYAGNITSTTDANGGTIQYFYNSLGQVSEIKDQEGNSEYFYYDEEGNLTKHIDRNENIVDREYNIDKNIISVEAYNINRELLNSGEEIEIKHNAIIKNEDNIIIQSEKPNKRRDFRKRVLDNLEKKEQGLDISENTNENISNLNTQYKIENNSKDENIQDKYKLNVISQRFKYNSDGSLNNAYSGNMQYNYTYNKEGLLESKSSSGKTLLKYTYDKNDNIKTIKDISGKSSIYSYDDADRVTLISDENKNNIANYSYYNNDNIKSVTLGNGIKSDYTYDGDGNVQSLVTISADGQVIVDYNYAYDLNGNRLQKVSSKHKNYYSYDSMNRLADSSYDERRESFTYDKVGNRLTKTTNDITEKYIYNVKNQLKELHQKDGINYFTFDKQGNTIEEKTENGNNIFQYNTLNQQVKAITKEGNTLVNRYDTEGLRYEIEENEKLSRFIFNKNGDILVETDSDDNVVSRFTRGYEIVAADTREFDQNSNCSINSSLSRCYYSVDEQGSTDFITDNYGKIRNEYWYDAFGNLLQSREDVHNRITYTGQQYDGVTQQYYLRARFYNPVIGRFTQEDVYRGDGLNLYAYCGNNPVGYFDPSGYQKKQPCPRGGNKEQQSKKSDEHHKMYGEHRSKDDELLFKGNFKSGNEGKKGKLNQQEALRTHTERKFLDYVNDDLELGDKLKMQGTLPPCKPGCQPAIRRVVSEKQVSVTYHASSNGNTYKWTPVDEKNSPITKGNKTLKGSVIQEVYDKNENKISSHRYWQNSKGRWKRAKY